MKSAIDNWILSADYDYKTALNLFKSGRYIYVLFFCHLSIEKTLKAIIGRRSGQMPPYTHNLNRLIELAGIVFEKPNQEFINKISLQSVPTRYPEDFVSLSKQISKKVAEGHLLNTKKVIKWLKQDYLKMT